MSELKEVWINQYCNGSIGTFETHEEANKHTDSIGSQRVACHRFVRVDEQPKTDKPAEKERLWPCEHIKWCDGVDVWWLFEKGHNSICAETWKYCPLCGSRRPDPEPAKVDWGKVKKGLTIKCAGYPAKFVAYDQDKIIARLDGKLFTFTTDDCQLAEELK